MEDCTAVALPSQQAQKVFESRGLNGHEGLVEDIKIFAGYLFDKLDLIPVPPGNNEAGRLVALAKTELESTVMWAVKAISRG